jgi:hypothetical protein
MVLKGRGFQPRQHRQEKSPALAAGASRLQTACGVGKEHGRYVCPRGLKAPIFQARHCGAAESRALSKQLHE